MDLLEVVNAATGLLGRAAPAAAAGSLRVVSDDGVARLLVEIERLGRLVDTLRVVAAAEAEERSRGELGTDGLAQRLGHSKGAYLIEYLTRVSQAEAARRVRLGSQIRPREGIGGGPTRALFPFVAKAMGEGRLGVESASRITCHLGQAARGAEPSALVEAEERLVEAAGRESADLVAVQARAYREALDPDGAEPRDEELRARRAFTIGREVNGMAPLRGWADPASSALIRAMFAESANPAVTPRFLDQDSPDPDSPDPDDGDVVDRVRDPRTREQRQFDILLGTISAGLRSVEGRPGSPRPLATVMAVVTLDDLRRERGVGWLDDVDEPVSAATIAQLVCDAGLRTVLLGDAGEVLHLGRTQRLFSTAQRKALAVRDGGCVWPQCTAPPMWCEAHHVVEYANGGRTDIDNGALLCSAHHHMLHASEFSMRMIRGKPCLLAPPWLDPDRILQPLGRTRALLRR